MNFKKATILMGFLVFFRYMHASEQLGSVQNYKVGFRRTLFCLAAAETVQTKNIYPFVNLAVCQILPAWIIGEVTTALTDRKFGTCIECLVYASAIVDSLVDLHQRRQKKDNNQRFRRNNPSTDPEYPSAC